MSIPITKHADVREETEHELFFADKRTPGAGMAFTCSPEGVVDESALQTPALENLAYARTHADEYESPALRSWTRRFREPAEGACPCGRTVVLADPMSNRCKCGTFYNGSGQALAHPSQWGEETGERFADDGTQVLGFGPEWEDPPIV